MRSHHEPCPRVRAARQRAKASSTRGPAVRGPRNGDWVRARVDTRDPTYVVGVLHLRHVPSLDYVQVNVDSGRLHDVDPRSIEVLRPQVVSIAKLEEGDPIKDVPGWRRIVDLGQAIAEGLVADVRERDHGTWANMFAELDRTVAPLLGAG